MNVDDFRVLSKFVQDFPEVREAFTANPASFLEKYAEVDLEALGIRRADLPGPEIVREHLESGRGRVSIAVCAVVV